MLAGKGKMCRWDWMGLLLRGLLGEVAYFRGWTGVDLVVGISGWYSGMDPLMVLGRA